MFQINHYLYHLTIKNKNNDYEKKNSKNFNFTNAGESDNPAVTFLKNRSIEVLLFNADNSSNRNQNYEQRNVQILK